jgi:hypothetical protein
MPGRYAAFCEISQWLSGDGEGGEPCRECIIAPDETTRRPHTHAAAHMNTRNHWPFSLGTHQHSSATPWTLDKKLSNESPIEDVNRDARCPSPCWHVEERALSEAPSSAGARLTLAGLSAAVVAQGLLAQSISIVQRNPTFKSCLLPLKSLVMQRVANGGGYRRDSFTRQRVLDSLLTFLILRSLSPDLLKRPESARRLLLPLWHLPRTSRGTGQAGRGVRGWGLVGGGGGGCLWMAQTPGSLSTLASVLVLGELVETAVGILLVLVGLF